VLEVPVCDFHLIRGLDSVAEVDVPKLKEYISQYHVGSILNSPFSSGRVGHKTCWTAKEWKQVGGGEERNARVAL
jgi:uncharacterized protein Usg